MARKLRVEYEGAIYHVMNRGDRQERSFGRIRTGSCFWKRWDRRVPRQVGKCMRPEKVSVLSIDKSGAKQLPILRTDTFFTGRTVPGAMDVLGSASSNATVTVNNQATYRKGDYFRQQKNLEQ